ncbi:MAG: YdeI/OmpD-associated family protein [Candidatus Woesearchaeota archaeon]|nr:YdeI/OmpD-associated family protein [Candidatus Woesearchaeota archaeon]
MQQVYAGTREEWRSWLENNHSKAKEVELVNWKKHTGKPSINHREQMEEAICFGWIDTTIKRIDEDRYARRFVRRTPKGKWSKNTLGYAKQLIKEGKMTPAGMVMYKHGLKNPLADGGIPDFPKIPALEKALSKNKKANAFFNSLTRPQQRMYLRWIASAKREETIQKRITETVERCAQCKKAFD